MAKKKSDQTLTYYKPRQKAALKTFKRILEVSLRIIEQENVIALNTNRVAEECGINIGTLYHYFPNKDAIILALYQGWHDAVVAKSAPRRATINKNTVPKRLYQYIILDSMEVEGYSCRSAIELERAMKLRPELDEVEEQLTEQLIQMYQHDMAIMVPGLLEEDREIQAPLMLTAVWGAIAIAAETEPMYYDLIAENAATMIAALFSNAKKRARPIHR